MPQLTISEVARQAGLQPSAIRYYEQIGLLPRAQRVGGQRRYDGTALYRIALIRRSRQLGLTLDEIRQLFFAFRDITCPQKRWRTLSQTKLEQLDLLMDAIKTMRCRLKAIAQNCQCETLDECGKAIFQSAGRDHRGSEPPSPVLGFRAGHSALE